MKVRSLLFLFCCILSSVNSQTITVKNPRVATATLIGISKPLTSLKSDHEPFFSRKKIENESIRGEHHAEFKQGIQNLNDDAALQKIYDDTSGTIVNIISNWEGLNASVDPSDNTLAVSANYIIQMTNNWNNSIMNIWDKSGTLVVEEINTGDISGHDDYGDPNIVYDRQSDRFIFCTLDPSFGTKLVICISQTGDPTGSWLGYRLNFPEGFPDYPKIAVWGDSYVLTTNSSTPSIWALNKNQMLNGDATISIQEFNLDRFGTIGFQSASPVTETGSVPPPPGSPIPIIRVGDDGWAGVDTDHLELYFVTVNWDDVSLSEITGPVNLNTIDYDSKLCGYDNWECVPQPETNQKLDPLGDIVMDKVQYLNFGDYESIVCSHVCRAYTSGYSGIRWYELRKNAGEENYFIYQQGTFAPNDENYRFMSSITMNEDRTIAIGYNISSDTIYPSIGVSGKTDCDSLGIMGAPEVIVQKGTRANNSNRYGDYNNIVSDPLDGSFWLTSNYNPSTSWKTRVVHFSIEKCSPTPPVDPNQENPVFGNLVMMPVPANETLQVNFTSSLDDDFELIIYDIAGQTVYDQKFDAVKGSNSFIIDLNLLASANYILHLITDEDEMVKQFSVQH